MNGTELKDWRSKFGWSQEDLAREIDLSLSTVARWEQLKELEIPNSRFLELALDGLQCKWLDALVRHLQQSKAIFLLAHGYKFSVDPVIRNAEVKEYERGIVHIYDTLERLDIRLHIQYLDVHQDPNGWGIVLVITRDPLLRQAAPSPVNLHGLLGQQRRRRAATGKK